jgi:hypothetical protein
MRQRCNNPNHPRYFQYGGKGIIVCEEWESFKNFQSWAISNGYDEDLTIDRINNNGIYEPSNCRWATRKQQENNMTRNHIITYDGISHTISEWADILGIKYNTMKLRVYRGWDMERIINTIYKGLSDV